MGNEKGIRNGILVAGNITLDITPVFELEKKAHSVAEVFIPGKVVHMDGMDIHPGGGASNTGLALKKLGADVRIIGIIGKDTLGDIIYDFFEEYGATGDLIIDESVPTSYSIVLAPPGIDRIFLHDPSAANKLTAEHIDKSLYKSMQIYHYGYPPISRMLFINEGRGCIEMFSAAKEAGIATSVDLCAVDPDCESGRTDWYTIIKKLCPYVDFFEPSIEELIFYLDRDRYFELEDEADYGDMIACLSIEDDIAPLAEQLLEWGAGVVLIKCGYKGMYLACASEKRLGEIGGDLPFEPGKWADKRIFEASYVPDKLLSGTGAGDTTIAAFLYAVLKGYPAEWCVKLAAATGASCVESYDALGGLRSFEELTAKINAGWKKQ